MNVTVSAARAATPSTAPVSACRPGGNVDRDDRAAARRWRPRSARPPRPSPRARGPCRTSRRRSRRPRATAGDQGSQRPPAATKSCVGAPRVARAAARGSPSATTARAQALGARHARDHVAVAAVVARSAEHRDRPRRRPQRAQRVERGVARRASSARSPGCRARRWRGDRARAPARRCRGRRSARACRPLYWPRASLPGHDGTRTHGSRSARSAGQGLGPRTRLPEGRHRGHRPARGRAAPARLARRRPARRDGLHGSATARSARGPAELVPGTLRVISARMDYWPGGADAGGRARRSGARLRVALRARARLPQAAAHAARAAGRPASRPRSGAAGYRAFTDSAPVLEKALARDAGLGWIGKHTNLLDRHDGSWFFLGEIFTDLPLPVDAPVTAHCGSCTACIDVCPTRAIVAPYELDARRCISYLTIELDGPIPEEFRAAIGNRIYGCDDCQLVCPWNRYAKLTAEPGLPAAPRPRRAAARRAVRVDRGRVPRAHGRQRHPPHRLRALAAQHRGRARQCAAGAGARWPRSKRGASIRARWCARRRLGAGASA